MRGRRRARSLWPRRWRPSPDDRWRPWDGPSRRWPRPSPASSRSRTAAASAAKPSRAASSSVDRARDLDPAERRRIETSGIRLLAAGPDLPAQLKAALAGRPAYVHLDCDVLEPGLVPTEYAVADGLTFAAFGRACAAIAEGGVVGLEVAEFEAAWPDGAPGDARPLVEALGALLAAVD